MINYKQVTLIGMSGVGKSTIGAALAQELEYSFVDTDGIIEQTNGVCLQELVDHLGDKRFLQVEEQTLLSIQPSGKRIISTGGSAVYSQQGMEHLRSQSVIVHLYAPADTILSWIPQLEGRGIVGLGDKDFSTLHKERLPLYQRYTDITIQLPQNFNLGRITRNLIGELKKVPDGRMDVH